MSQMLIQIVPGLPPATNGVGDYALTVARVMRQQFGLNTVFVVGDDRWQGPDNIQDFRVWKLPARSAVDLEAVLAAIQATSGSSSVLLQLSIYGYAARGCPFWLLEGLKRWKSKQSDSQLVTMFHELYAFGPPWRSEFWLSALQKRICVQVARLSNTAVTNMHQHRATLERFDPSKRDQISVLAIPSSVGEPLVSVALNLRAKHMIIFGQKPLRKQAYEKSGAALRRACQQLGITEIHDVGVDFGGIPDRVGDVQVSKHGLMGASELSSLMSSSFAGFVDYPRGYLAKSGVFAAYCAHRLIPVTPGDSGSEADGITCGIQYCSVEGKHATEPLMSNMQSIADAAWNWYQNHSLKSHALTFAEVVLTDSAHLNKGLA